MTTGPTIPARSGAAPVGAGRRPVNGGVREAFLVPPAAGPVAGRFEVPPSKSIHQRVLALAVLADGPSFIEARGAPAGDVLLFAHALSALAGREIPVLGEVGGAFADGALGAGRDSRVVHLGMNATGFRIATVLACLRPGGARTLLRGDRRLLVRPHGTLLKALRALGAHAIRRPSGSVRVIGGGLGSRGARVGLSSEASSQFATALLLGAPRAFGEPATHPAPRAFGESEGPASRRAPAAATGLDLRLVGEPVSAPYLRLTVAALAAFGVPVVAGPEASRLRVPAAAPRGTRFLVEPDASSAAVWWAAAALTGGDVVVPGLSMESAQADLALLPVLVRMGAAVDRIETGEPRVRGPGRRLDAPGEVDLRGAPDLAPLVAVLAAGARGTTRVVRAPHLRFKESDRIEAVVAAVRAVGGEAEGTEDGFVIRGRALRRGDVDVVGDHRLALAFGVLGLGVPGVSLTGAAGRDGGVAGKSYPGFLAALARAAGGGGGGQGAGVAPEAE